MVIRTILGLCVLNPHLHVAWPLWALEAWGEQKMVLSLPSHWELEDGFHSAHAGP